jgi:hypothetical protein
MAGRAPGRDYRQRDSLPDDDDSISLRIGRHNESLTAELFAEQRPEFALMGTGRELFAHPERPWQMATPDRLVDEVWFEPDDSAALIREERRLLAVLECKTDGGFDGWGEDGTDEIPVHYRCQVLWQMDVMDVSTGFVACLFMNRRQLRVYELTRDDAAEADLKLMREEAEAFLAGLASGTEPDIDWRPATSETLRRLHPDVEDVDVAVKPMLVIQYRAACKAYKAAEQRKKLAENRLRLLLGDGHRITDERTGEVIARRDVYDVKEHTRKGCRVDKLVQVKPRGERS